MEAQDIISKKPVSADEASEISERLFSTHTISSKKEGPPRADHVKNEVARDPATEDEMLEIYKRLHGTGTKSSKGGEACEAPSVPKVPGYGLKAYPIIEGIETKFKGESPLAKDKMTEAVGRMHTTQTRSSQSRRDNPRILLYPERTTLMNNVERIVAYQQTGSVAKQNMLQRREKWFN